jgi:hypothetical protein
LPRTFNETDYELSKPDVEKTDALFQELEFRQMKAHSISISAPEKNMTKLIQRKHSPPLEGCPKGGVVQMLKKIS